VAVSLMEQRAIVLSNGIIEDINLIRTRLVGWDQAQVIAADAGSQHAHSLGLTLDVILGDFDSMAYPAESKGIKLITARTDKDETDLELALLYAVASGADSIIVLGAFGGRLDMALANIFLLVDPRLAGKEIVMWEGSQTAWVMRPVGGVIRGQAGDTVSLIPLGGDADGVITHNLQYSLNGETLRFGPARGVSNVMTAAESQVDLARGTLLIVHTPGRA
jgi:thiamine pyrophosphokinase